MHEPNPRGKLTNTKAARGNVADTRRDSSTVLKRSDRSTKADQGQRSRTLPAGAPRGRGARLFRAAAAAASPPFAPAQQSAQMRKSDKAVSSKHGAGGRTARQSERENSAQQSARETHQIISRNKPDRPVASWSQRTTGQTEPHISIAELGLSQLSRLLRCRKLARGAVQTVLQLRSQAKRGQRV
jgi:hypothetical protein